MDLFRPKQILVVLYPQHRRADQDGRRQEIENARAARISTQFPRKDAGNYDNARQKYKD